MSCKSILGVLSVFLILGFSNIQAQVKDTEKKYVITNECITRDKAQICRIKALRYIGGYVNEGHIKSFIQSKKFIAYK